MKHCLSNKLQLLEIGSTLESAGISFVIIMCDWVMYTLKNMIYADIGSGSVYSICLNLFCRRKLCRKCKYANLNQMKNLIKMCRNIWHNISKFRGPLNAFLLFLRRENYVNVDILHRSLASKCDGRKLELDAFAWTWMSRISITLCSVIIHIGFITRALKSRW